LGDLQKHWDWRMELHRTLTECVRGSQDVGRMSLERNYTENSHKALIRMEVGSLMRDWCEFVGSETAVRNKQACCQQACRTVKFRFSETLATFLPDVFV
jgi:hypothetical protein